MKKTSKITERITGTFKLLWIALLLPLFAISYLILGEEDFFNIE